MRFGLDFVWISDGKVAAVNRNVPAPKPGTATNDLKNYPSPGPIDYVLEISAGAAATLNVGDDVIIANPKSI